MRGRSCCKAALRKGDDMVSVALVDWRAQFFELASFVVQQL